MKNFFNKLLKSIEEANKQNFGNKKMDCCDLNQTSSGNSTKTKQIKSKEKQSK